MDWFDSATEWFLAIFIVSVLLLIIIYYRTRKQIKREKNTPPPPLPDPINVDISEFKGKVMRGSARINISPVIVIHTKNTDLKKELSQSNRGDWFIFDSQYPDVEIYRFDQDDNRICHKSKIEIPEMKPSYGHPSEIYYEDGCLVKKYLETEKDLSFFNVFSDGIDRCFIDKLLVPIGPISLFAAIVSIVYFLFFFLHLLSH
jgi:hypothetical protein